MTNKKRILIILVVLAFVQCFTFQLCFASSTPKDIEAPSVPGELAFVTSDTVSITFSWTPSTDNVGVKGYYIYRNGAKIKSLNVTEFKDTGLLPDKTNTYFLKAYDSAGNISEASPTFTASTTSDIIAPSVPSGLQVASVTGTSISLAWEASSDNTSVKGYEIYRDGVRIKTTSSRSYINTGLMPDTNYVYTVNAYDAYGNISSLCEPLNALTSPDTSNPSAPANLTVTQNTATSVSLVWDASNDDTKVKGYEIYKNGVKIGSTCSLAYTSNNLIPCTSYNYTVKAYDIVNKFSEESSTAVAVTGVDTEAPSIPGNISLKSETATTASISWTCSTDNWGIKTYEIFSNGTSVGKLKGSAYTVTGLMPGTSYSITLKAIDLADNYSESSGELLVTTNTSYAAPTSLKVSSKTDSDVNLSWCASKDSANITGYIIYKDGIQIGTSVGTSYKDTGLQPGVSYTYTVKATDALGNLSDESNSISVLTCIIISQDTQWTPENGPHIISDSIIVAEGATLEILPGTIVLINPARTITVNGKIIAMGDETEKIVFTSSKDPAYGGSGVNVKGDYWETIIVGPAGEFDGDNLKIVYGNKLINVLGALNITNSEIGYANSYGITVATTGQMNGSGLNIHNCCVAELCKGLYILGSVNIYDSVVTDCPGSGVIIANTGIFNGTAVRISKCDKGIDNQGSLNLVLSEISNCNYGIYFNTTNYDNIILNSFLQNNEYGLYNSKPNEITIEASMNYWGSESGPSVYDETSQTWTKSGDKVGDGIEYTDWLQEPPM